MGRFAATLSVIRGRYRGFWRGCPSLNVQLNEIGQFRSARVNPVSKLSDRQWEALETALELGYYDQPRQVPTMISLDGSAVRLTRRVDTCKKPRRNSFVLSWGCRSDHLTTVYLRW
ncbi:helix-turn-helix domain-containing protein [Halostella salina]|uniref:helix-turn-helix domain-containing protein n=1 Tax=Halostella salina TaxID=1547897 RepID=UPI000EF81669